VRKSISLCYSILTGQVTDMWEKEEIIAINVKSTETKTQKKIQSVSDLLKAKLTSSNIPTSK